MTKFHRRIKSDHFRTLDQNYNHIIQFTEKIYSYIRKMQQVISLVKFGLKETSIDNRTEYLFQCRGIKSATKSGGECLHAITVWYRAVLMVFCRW